MTSMTILGARTVRTPGATVTLPGLPAQTTAPSSELRWRVAVQGYGRDRYYPALRDRVRVIEFAARDREDLRARVERASCADAAAYLAGD